MIENVILEIGKPRFSARLFDEVSRALNLRQMVAYRFDPIGKIELLFAASRDGEEAMHRAIRDYSTSLHARDPLRRHLQVQRERQFRVHHVEARKISDTSFRQNLYVSQRMASKTAIVIRRPADAIAIGFFRGDDAGEFSGRQWDFLNQSAGAVAAAVERHVDLCREPPVADWASRLEAVACSQPLSRQEIAVCSQILDGYFNEAISLNMGISVHSVITYRRRAFAKMRVGTQNELFNLLVCGRAN